MLQLLQLLLLSAAFTLRSRSSSNTDDNDDASASPEGGPVIVGVNYVPSYARNDVQIWQDFNATTIDRELGYAREFGFNSVRVFLASIVWKHNPRHFMQSYETFLSLCAAHNLTALVVAFDRDFPNCKCGLPSGSTNCTGGCGTPSTTFLLSGAYKHSSWCPNPGAGITSLGPSGWGYLHQFVEATLGGKYAADERIYAVELINEPHEDELVPFIDHMALFIKNVSGRPLAHEPAYNHKSTTAMHAADIWSQHIYGANPETSAAQMYVSATRDREAAAAQNKGVLITEFAKRPSQPYCDAMRGALAASVGSYAWELMLGVDQFGPQRGRSGGIGPPFATGPIYQGLIWPNGSAYSEAEKACFQRPVPWHPPTPAPLPPPVLPPGCTRSTHCAFLPPSDTAFQFTPALSAGAACWHLARGPGYCGGTRGPCPTEVAYCPAAGASVKIHVPPVVRTSASRVVQLLYKSYHDCGIFTVSVGGHVLETIDAYSPSSAKWWSAVTLPSSTAAVITVKATGRKNASSTNSYVQLVGLRITLGAPSTSHHDGAAGNLTLSRALGSNMVLQRAPKRARLWGWASPAEPVTVHLELPQRPPHSVTTITGADGRWETTLPPMPAATAGSLLFTTPSGGHQLLRNIAVGDVYLCSGQSHMQFSVNLDLEGEAAIATSARYPGIRMMTITPEASIAPREDLASTVCPAAVTTAGLAGHCNSSWLVSEPANFGQQQAFTFPSAICYFFARSLYTSQPIDTYTRGQPTPIGIISAAVGGTKILQWMSDAAQRDQSCGGVNVSRACPPASGSHSSLPPNRVLAEKGHVQGVSDPRTLMSTSRSKSANTTLLSAPGSFYYGMIAPLRRMAMRGILFDQGTSDSDESCVVWGCQLSSLANDWRVRAFNDPSLLFTVDQLRAANMGGGGVGVPGFAALIPHSAFATRADLSTCLPNTTFDGHSRRKAEVGRRLALAAQVIELRQPSARCSFGPLIESVTVATLRGGQLLNISVKLSHAETLHFGDAPECDGCCHGRSGEHILGLPATGDSWTLGFADGRIATVCKDKSAGCNGAANLRADGTVDWLVMHPSWANTTHVPPIISNVSWVEYGGSVPFLSQSSKEIELEQLPRQLPLGCSARFGMGACGIYNGVGSFDDHMGIPMAAQVFRARQSV
jgi:sialate O-acetylesterase